MNFTTFLGTIMSVIPIVHADDDELVDPLEALRNKCKTKAHIEALYSKYQQCADRVNSRSKTTETCMEELIDYINELDHCATHSLFHQLK